MDPIYLKWRAHSPVVLEALEGARCLTDLATDLLVDPSLSGLEATVPF